MRLQRHSVIHLIVILGLGFVAAGPAAGDEELDDLQRLYSDILAEYNGAGAVVSNPESTDSEIENARNKLGQLEPILDELSKEIKNKGGTIAEPARLKAKPGSEVTARHKARDTEGSVTKPVESPCDSYSDFKLPKTSLYSLPPWSQQSGAKRKAGEALLRAEREFAEHLVGCEGEWKYQSALDWDSTRAAWAYRIRRLEEQYAWAFSTYRYSKEENALLIEAYKNSPKIKIFRQEEDDLYREYIELKDLADKVTARFRYAVDAPTRLSLLDTVEKAKEARTKWRKKANQITALKGPEIDIVRQVRAARTQRGIREMKKYHPGTKFTLHTMKDLTASKSEPISKLLGSAGLRILEDEGGRRHIAIMTRRQ